MSIKRHKLPHQLSPILYRYSHSPVYILEHLGSLRHRHLVYSPLTQSPSSNSPLLSSPRLLLSCKNKTLSTDSPTTKQNPLFSKNPKTTKHTKNRTLIAPPLSSSEGSRNTNPKLESPRNDARSSGWILALPSCRAPTLGFGHSCGARRRSSFPLGGF